MRCRGWVDGLGYKPGSVLDEPLYRHDRDRPAKRTEVRGEKPTDAIPNLTHKR